MWIYWNLWFTLFLKHSSTAYNLDDETILGYVQLNWKLYMVFGEADLGAETVEKCTLYWTRTPMKPGVWSELLRQWSQRFPRSQPSFAQPPFDLRPESSPALLLSFSHTWLLFFLLFLCLLLLPLPGFLLESLTSAREVQQEEAWGPFTCRGDPRARHCISSTLMHFRTHGGLRYYCHIHLQDAKPWAWRRIMLQLHLGDPWLNVTLQFEISLNKYHPKGRYWTTAYLEHISYNLVIFIIWYTK